MEMKSLKKWVNPSFPIKFLREELELYFQGKILKNSSWKEEKIQISIPDTEGSQNFSISIHQVK